LVKAPFGDARQGLTPAPLTIGVGIASSANIIVAVAYITARMRRCQTPGSERAIPADR